jgi:flagellar biosynthesis/type III secretory pathway protein FliH
MGRVLTGEVKVAPLKLGERPERRAAAIAPVVELLESAREEAERIKSRAALEGRERGLQTVTELLVRAREEVARMRSEAEQDLKTLAVRIAEKVLASELELRPSAIVEVVKQVLEHAGDAEQLTVRVSPGDLPLLERGKTKLTERTRGILTFRADESIGRGGCIVESALGIVDARLSTQLEAIERALRGDSE